MGEEVFIGIGSNLGDRLGNCRLAVQRLQAHPGLEVRKVSSGYETEPVDAEGGWFVNGVVMAEASFDPFELLAVLKGIEREMGRPTLEKRGEPRTIDLDILLYGQAVIETPSLIIPHPRMHERRFVLLPLREIAPRVRHPLLKLTAEELLLHLCDPHRVKRLEVDPAFR